MKITNDFNGVYFDFCWKDAGIDYSELMRQCSKYFVEQREKAKHHVEDIFYATDVTIERWREMILLFNFLIICGLIELVSWMVMRQ